MIRRARVPRQGGFPAASRARAVRPAPHRRRSGSAGVPAGRPDGQRRFWPCARIRGHRDLLVALRWQLRDNREDEPAADRWPAAAGVGGGFARAAGQPDGPVRSRRGRRALDGVVLPPRVHCRERLQGQGTVGVGGATQRGTSSIAIRPPFSSPGQRENRQCVRILVVPGLDYGRVWIVPEAPAAGARLVVESSGCGAFRGADSVAPGRNQP